MRTGRLVALLLAIALFVGYLVYGSLRVVQVECELCVTFRGQRTCRTGSGENEEEARRAAQRAACAVMASGMDASIACQNATPDYLSCGR